MEFIVQPQQHSECLFTLPFLQCTHNGAQKSLTEQNSLSWDSILHCHDCTLLLRFYIMVAFSHGYTCNFLLMMAMQFQEITLCRRTLKFLCIISCAGNVTTPEKFPKIKPLNNRATFRW